MAETTRIVVADASRARVVERRGKAATGLEDFLNLAGRAHGRNRTPEASGRFFATGGPAAGPAHAAGPDTDPVERSIDLFAKRVARALDQGRVRQRYDALCLVGPPRMLGRLRTELTPETARRVEQELDQNLAALDLRALLERIGPAA